MLNLMYNSVCTRKALSLCRSPLKWLGIGALGALRTAAVTFASEPLTDIVALLFEPVPPRSGA
jgi:hypothetical protein